FLDLLTVKFLNDFGRRPQHLLGSIGLGCFLVAFFGLTYFGLAAAGLPVLIASMAALVLGTQALLAGLLAERMTASDEARQNGSAMAAPPRPLPRVAPPLARPDQAHEPQRRPRRATLPAVPGGAAPDPLNLVSR